MSIARHYVMQAAEGRADEAIAAFAPLLAALRAIPGFEGADVLRDIAQPGRLVFIERWASIAAHEAGGALLPKAALAPLMAALAGRPEAAYLEYLPT